MIIMYNVAILLSTYNGEKYLQTLLNSLLNQRKVFLTIFVIDDNSTDNTLEILNNTNLNIKIFANEGEKDPVKNFMKLIKLTSDDFEYYCFCDQDDYWLKNKLIYSIFKLNKNKAFLAASRTIITDENLKFTGVSKNFQKKPSLQNSLVQCIAGGNTMVWTRKFHQLLKLHPIYSPAFHDWYLYQFCTYFKYNFIYINRPTILYRQHKNNFIGSNMGFSNIIKRIFIGFNSQYKYWLDKNKFHLINFEKFNHPSESEIIVNNFYSLRKQYFFRVYKLYKLKIYRQTFLGQIMLYFATIFFKI